MSGDIGACPIYSVRDIIGSPAGAEGAYAFGQ